MTTASIVIPSRGGAERLPRLLGSLAAQTYPEWEAIVVVDGDIDNSEGVVARYAHLPVRTILFPENRGRVAALNAGFAAALGEVLIRCDDDFELAPNHVAAHVEPHEREVCGVVGLPINIAPPNAYMRVYGALADQTGRQDAYATAASGRWRHWGGNVSVTRGTYDRLGGYDSRYQGYGWEDLDFGFRLHEQGVPINLVRAAEVRHHMASVTTTIRAGRAFASGRARWTFDTIHGTGASGPARPEDSSAWNRIVNHLANRLTQRRSTRLAKAIDLALPLLPTPAGRKAVAAVVEASSVAGYRVAQASALTVTDPTEGLLD